LLYVVFLPSHASGSSVFPVNTLNFSEQMAWCLGQFYRVFRDYIDPCHMPSSGLYLTAGLDVLLLSRLHCPGFATSYCKI